MQNNPMQREVVIKQLVRQQFYSHPNFIIDRTQRLQIEVHGASCLFNEFSSFLFEISNNLNGSDPNLYSEIINKAGNALNLQPDTIRERFHDKTNGLLGENLATEDILFIAAIASILEVLDIRHFKDLLDNLYNSFIQFCIQGGVSSFKESKNLSSHFDKGIKRLGEIADEHFSLLQNITKCEDLAQIFKIQIKYDRFLVQEYIQKVIDKIISGGI
ncbi:MAG: hypothetical protein ACXAC8_09695 [Candidatus Hodarchaeales archaeon]|jgi:hypothetical protein